MMQFLASGQFGWQRSVKLLVISSLLIILGFSAVCVSVMLDMRRGEEELARQTGENLASTIDADISRNIEVFDLSLRAVSSNLATHEIDSVSRELRHLILFDRAATAKHFGAIQVFTASGNLTIDSSTLDPEPRNVMAQEFFRVHRDNPDVGLFISRPLIERGAQAIFLSRRINDDKGDFAGVVAGTIRFSYFHELFGRLKLGQDDTITVLRNDGIVMTRRPFDIGFIGRNIRTAASRMLKEPTGSLSTVSAIDGIERLFVWHGNEKGLVVIFGKPWSAIYAIWYRQALWIGSVMSILIAVAGLMTFLLAREITRRARAEASLKELATTDGLTALSNRRKFDSELDLEWRRASRSREPVALLIIDVDHFKSYNDRFGHQAGDVALTAVGKCIARFAKRPGDCAARYGGEEFALLLPGVAGAVALRVAETLRQRVSEALSEPAPVTISIGVAALSGNAAIAPKVLIELADRALYDAKRGGRNCCRKAVELPAVVAA